MMASPSADQLPYFGPLLDHSEDAIVACDADWRVTVWNEGARGMYGWTAEEAVGRPAAFLGLDESDEQRMDRRRQLAEHGRWRGETTVERRDGSEVPVESSVVAIRDEEGRVSGYLGIHRDITDRKRAEEALRAANRRTEAILERISDTFFAVDDQWRYTYVNERAVATASKAWDREVSAEELLGKNCWELFPETAGTAFDQELRRAVREQRVVEFEAYSLATDAWVEVRAYPSSDGLSVYSRDVTARRRGQEALAYHASLLENVDDAVVGTDPEFRLTIWNSGAERLYGWAREEVLGRDARDVASYAGDRSRLELEAELLETGRTRTEITGYRKDGAGVEVELISVAVRTPDGAVTGYLGIHRDVSERKRAEEALREANRRTEQILESITDHFWAVDREWRYTYVNQRVLAQARLAWGREVTAEEVLGKRCWEMVPEQVGTTLDHEMRRALREQTVVEFEQSSASTSARFEVRIYPLADGLAVLAHDITERTRAEQALREAERRSETILESITDDFVAVDHDWRYTYINDRALRSTQDWLGWPISREELLGRSLWEVLPETVGTVPYLKYHEAVRDGRPVQFETYFAAKDRWFETHVYPSESGLSIYFRTITERKQAEEALREANRRSETILESIGDHFFAMDGDWRITYMNQRLLASTGSALSEELSLDDLLGKNYWEVFPETVGTEIDREFHRAVRDQEIVGFEAVSPLSGRWFDICAYPTDNGLSVYSRDITDRKKAEQRLVEAREAERGRIARALHDEALQSLTDAVALATTADRTKAEPRLTDQLLPILRRAGAQLRAAIYDLRLESEEHSPFVELLERLVDEHRAMAGDSEIQLEIGDGSPARSLGVSGIEVLRILGEALTNARRHAQARRVRVRVWGANAGLWVEVSDDGRGFEAATPASPNHHGITGMRERAKLLNGRLEIHSEPGVGTRMLLEAPLGDGMSGDT
jgi:PAS domain S-box-containing protein